MADNLEDIVLRAINYLKFYLTVIKRYCVNTLPFDITGFTMTKAKRIVTAKIILTTM